MQEYFVATQSVPGKPYTAVTPEHKKEIVIGLEGHWIVADRLYASVYCNHQVPDDNGHPKGYKEFIQNGETIAYVRVG